MQIVTNTAAIALGNQIETNTRELSDRFSSLSSGKRLQSAADDSANLQISNRLNKLGRGMQVAIRNANDGISTLQTAEGALQETTNILHRMRDLSIQAANATNRYDDLKSLNQEFGDLKQELNRIAETTSYGGQKLLDGSLGIQSFQVGAESNEIIEASFISTFPDDLTLAKKGLDGQALSAIHTGSDLNTARSNLDNNGFGVAGPVSEILTLDGVTEQSIQLSSGDSAEKMAAKINQVFNSTGVDAQAINKVTLHVQDGVATNRTGFTEGEQVSFELGNGMQQESISFTSTGEYNQDLIKMRERINESAAATGISAVFDDDAQQLILKSDDGKNIEVSDFYESDGTVLNQLTLQSIDVDGNVANSVSLDDDGSAVILRGHITLNSPNGELFTASSNIDFGIVNSGIGTANELIQSDQTSLSNSSLSSHESAQKAISTIDAVLAKVDRSRASFGAVMNRLVSTVHNLSNVHENTENARSQIVDADYSKEAAELTKLQVTQQASTALLSQANTMGEQAVRLLG
ncbi:flagellin [Psychrosphaera sp.]|nr:flagellin [Psychrosphaera sp.]